LTPDEFIFLIREGYIDIPNVTEDDIKDKSKGDMVSKGFTVLQTGRFVMQYIARRAQRLPVTELELATLAFAVTNTATYIFWWNKPLNVQSPVQVALKKPVSDGDWERCTRFMGSAEMVDYESPWPRTKIEEEVGFEKEPPSKGVSDLEIADHRSTSREGVHPTEDETRTWPIYMFESARTDQALEWQQRTTQQRVHRWYSGHLSPRQLLVSFLVAGASAETFGAIHCMAWYFSFPSEAEQTLWRICCIVIMGLPVLLAMIYATLTLFYKSLRPYRPVVRYAVMTTRYVYVLARAAILVQVFISLRSVPPGVFDSIDWITFIPHA
jgi:hypothetical protein